MSVQSVPCCAYEKRESKKPAKPSKTYISEKREKVRKLVREYA